MSFSLHSFFFLPSWNDDVMLELQIPCDHEEKASALTSLDHPVNVGNYLPGYVLREKKYTPNWQSQCLVKIFVAVTIHNRYKETMEEKKIKELLKENVLDPKQDKDLQSEGQLSVHRWGLEGNTFRQVLLIVQNSSDKEKNPRSFKRGK